MKLTAVLLMNVLCTTELLLASPGFGQGREQQRISLDLSKASLAVVFEAIEKKADVIIMYENTDVVKRESIDINVRDTRVADILDEVLAGKSLKWSILDRVIRVERADVGLEIILPEQPVTGVIRDQEGKPLVGATISIKGRKVSVVSDKDGAFTIQANTGDELIISYVGYKTQTIKISSGQLGIVALESAETSLNEVVVNKGYYKEKQRLSTGSVSTVTSKEISRQPVVGPMLALQGRVPGLEIRAATGSPGAAPQILIRGVSSLGGRPASQPLYVIDGVIIEAAAIKSPTPLYGLNVDGRDPLENISPENIESIDVLKDADATAIYGSRGANGVILITTKKSSRTEKLVTEVNMYHGKGKVPHFMDVLNTKDYLMLRREAMANGGTTVQPWDYDFLLFDSTKNTNWQKTLLGGTASFTDINASISGGGKYTTFRFGGIYHKESSFATENLSDQSASGNFNFNYTSPSQFFTFTSNINFGATHNLTPNSSDLVNFAPGAPPNAPDLYNADGSLNWALFVDAGGIQRNAITNPLSYLMKTSSSKSKLLITNTALQFQLMPGLSFKTTFGYTFTTQSEVSKNPIASQAPVFVEYLRGRSYFGDNERNSWIIEPQLNYSRQINDHQFDAIVGSTFQESTNKYFAVEGEDYTSDALLDNLMAATRTNIRNDEFTQYRYTAVYARLGYNWKQKYLLNLTGRRDGSSRFGPGRQFGDFGAVGAAWIFSQERALQHSRIISFGKLRASYGSTGSDQIGDYVFYDLFDVDHLYYQGSITLKPTRLFNENFRWELTRKLEVALEMGLLKDRINMQVAWYRNRTSNQLIQYTLPATTGFQGIRRNFDATIENSGWEFGIHSRNISGKDFQWSTSANLSIPRNKLIAFPGIEVSTYRDTYIVGQSVRLRKSYTWTGIDPQTGLHTVKDTDGNGFISYEDTEVHGSEDLKFYGGLSNNFSYRSFNLSFHFQFCSQTSESHLISGTGPYLIYLGNESVDILNRWQKPGDITTIPKLSTDPSMYESSYNASASNYAIVDASYIRLKTVSLSYEFPQAMKQRLHLNGLQVFLQGQNLLTFTSYKGIDPETLRSIPILRVITGGVQVKF